MSTEPEDTGERIPSHPNLIGAVVEWTEDNRPMPDHSSLIGEDACFDTSLIITRRGTVMAIAANKGAWKVLVSPLDDKSTKRKGSFEEVQISEITVVETPEEVAKRRRLPKKPLLHGRFPFTVIRDPLTGYESIHCRIHPPSNPPIKTGLILVALWGDGEYALVRATELGYEYVEERDEPASPAEWQWWMDLSTFTFLDSAEHEDRQYAI